VQQKKAEVNKEMNFQKKEIFGHYHTVKSSFEDLATFPFLLKNFKWCNALTN
jgi:hypothetical protein